MLVRSFQVAKAPHRRRWRLSRRPGSQVAQNPTEAGELMAEVVTGSLKRRL